MTSIRNRKRIHTSVRPRTVTSLAMAISLLAELAAPTPTAKSPKPITHRQDYWPFPTPQSINHTPTINNMNALPTSKLASGPRQTKHVYALTDLQKKAVVEQYQAKRKVCDIAHDFRVSERTINRVLVAAGLATTTARLKGEAYGVMKLLQEYGVQPEQVEAVILDAKKWAEHQAAQDAYQDTLAKARETIRNGGQPDPMEKMFDDIPG